MMSRQYLQFLFCLLVVQYATSLKIISLIQPYLVQAPSTTLVQKEQPPEELPVYRDLPPIKHATKDLTEALEATRNLQFTRPPLDVDAFFASLKKAAEEVRSVVVGIAPPIADIQISKADVMDLVKKSEEAKDEPIAKSSHEPFSASPKAATVNLPVKRSDSSFVKYITEEDATLLKQASEVNVKVQAPFTDLEVRKAALEEGELATTEVPIPNTDVPVPPDTGMGVGARAVGVGVGVHVDVPYTNVQVHKDGGSGYGYGYGTGGQVGVNVEAPFTSVKVRKTLDYPGFVPPGTVPEMGVRVQAPFVNVKVDGPVHKAHGVVDGDQLVPRRNGKPLNLDINIPGIFNLRLLRDQNGRGRLGIGVLPAFSSFVNQHPASDYYPGPPPS